MKPQATGGDAQGGAALRQPVRYRVREAREEPPAGAHRAGADAVPQAGGHSGAHRMGQGRGQRGAQGRGAGGTGEFQSSFPGSQLLLRHRPLAALLLQ